MGLESVPAGRGSNGKQFHNLCICDVTGERTGERRFDVTGCRSVLDSGRSDLPGSGFDGCGCSWLRRESGRGVGNRRRGLGHHHGSQIRRACADQIHGMGVALGAG